jgi:integrase
MDNSFRKPRRREYLTQEEIEPVLAACKTSSRNPVRDYCMALLMFRHGLRVSELCSIKLSDINLETKEFHVNRLKGCNGGPHELYNGETPAVRAWLAERAKIWIRDGLRNCFENVFGSPAPLGLSPELGGGAAIRAVKSLCNLRFERWDDKESGRR